MTYHWVYNKSNTTDATRGAGTGDPSGAHVVSYRSLLVLLSFFLLVMLYFLCLFFSWSCCISCVFFSLGHVVFPVSFFSWSCCISCVFFSLGHVVFPVSFFLLVMLYFLSIFDLQFLITLLVFSHNKTSFIRIITFVTRCYYYRIAMKVFQYS